MAYDSRRESDSRRLADVAGIRRSSVKNEPRCIAQLLRRESPNRINSTIIYGHGRIRAGGRVSARESAGNLHPR